MSRHTTFRFCLDPTVEQCEVLARHDGAARTQVPWTGFDLINEFNAWKKTGGAGRVFAVDTTGVAELVVTGLPWRRQVCQQVFEEAAVDCGRALSAWSGSRLGKRKGKRVGFPRFKKKTGVVASFRLRNKHPKSGSGCMTIPAGLRRLLATDRAKILFATITHRAGRWWVSLNVEAADLHPAHTHPARAEANHTGWVVVDEACRRCGRRHRRRRRGGPQHRCA